MNRIWMLAASILFLSMGNAEQPSWTGQLAVKGNEPFTVLTLSDSQGREWQLDGNSTPELRRTAQGRTVRVFGILKGNDTIVVERWTILDSH